MPHGSAIRRTVPCHRSCVNNRFIPNQWTQTSKQHFLSIFPHDLYSKIQTHFNFHRQRKVAFHFISCHVIELLMCVLLKLNLDFLHIDTRIVVVD